VPEKHSVVSFVHDIRRKGLEPERRVSAAGLCTTTPIPMSKHSLEPGDASAIVVKRRGNFEKRESSWCFLNKTKIKFSLRPPGIK
jgi:hypothetical protein